MNASHSFGPPSSNNCARMLSSSVTGSYLRPQAAICASTGNNGYDDPAGREHGTGALLDNLGEALKRESAGA
jgi:hypothetical protein